MTNLNLTVDVDIPSKDELEKAVFAVYSEYIGKENTPELMEEMQSRITHVVKDMIEVKIT